jgi:hypothetical protein
LEIIDDQLDSFPPAIEDYEDQNDFDDAPHFGNN